VLLRCAAIAALLAACGGDNAVPDAGEVCAVGDPAAAPVLQVIGHGGGAIEDGGTIALEVPPQGGLVAFAGLRARNVDLCGASVQAALRDPCTGRVVGYELRPVAWRIAEDGFAEPAQPAEISDFANIPACPNAAISHDVDGHPLTLEVRLYETSGRTTEVTLTVTPQCPAEGDYCRCICDSDYDLGADCPDDPDGGVDCPPASR